MVHMRGLAVGVMALSIIVIDAGWCQDTSEAFSFGYLTRETRYREFIRRGDSLTQEGLDTLASVWKIPITTWTETQGVVYRNGAFLLTIYDRTAGDTLDMIEHYPSDTSHRVRMTVVQNGIVSAYNASGELIRSLEMQIDYQERFRSIVERITRDSLAKVHCDANLIFGQQVPLTLIRRFLDSARSIGIDVRYGQNGLIVIRITLPDTLDDGSTNPLSGGIADMLIDTVTKRLLLHAIYSPDSVAIMIASYYYDNSGNLIREYVESYDRYDDGTQLKNVLIREYINRSFQCYLKED
jgi:hypothetical protein